MDHRQIAGRVNAALRHRADVMLVGGAAEPLYLPAAGNRPAMIRYTRDFAPSVLHELAHWCLATPERRRVVDYGLRYQPPPRGPAAQARFYRAEAPVQGLEMLLARVCGVVFRISSDNPGVDDWSAQAHFEARVHREFDALVANGPGAAAEGVLEALNPAWRSLVGAGWAGGCAAGAGGP